VNLIGNIIFLIFGGFVIFIGYVLGGIALCLTIVGIPLGFQCFKLAGGVLAPFGREVYEVDPPAGPLTVILNIIWIILPGLELAAMHADDRRHPARGATYQAPAPRAAAFRAPDAGQ